MALLAPARLQVVMILFGLKETFLPSAFIMIIFRVIIHIFLEEINPLLRFLNDLSDSVFKDI